MREFVVTEVRCEKGIKATEICDKVLEKVKYNRLFFEFQNLFKWSDTVSERKKKKLAELDLTKYAYVRVFEHTKSSPYYDPKKDDRQLISNLNSAWFWYNETENDSLDESKFRDIVAFGDTVGSHVSTVMYGIDEIEWGGKPVAPGTYGYEKAEGLYDGGNNYLSNSVIVSKIRYEGKPFKVYVSCEKEYRDLEIVEEMISSLGKKIGEKTYFAPENEEERHEWEETYREAEGRYKAMIAKTKELAKTLPKRFEPQSPMAEFNDKINVKKSVKNCFCPDGWELEYGNTVSKRKGDSVITVYIDSLHKGHYLQALMDYRSIKFYFGDNINYIFTLKDEADVCAYLDNVKIMAEAVYEMA